MVSIDGKTPTCIVAADHCILENKELKGAKYRSVYMHNHVRLHVAIHL